MGTVLYVGKEHDYQLKPDDLKILSDAQLFVVNGAGMEAFMDKVVN